jgi:maltose alpha-D-glucosyltransferase/alpha-amylase
MDALPARLPRWLPAQRWFGGKSRTIAGTTIADIIWLGRPPQHTALLIVDVRYERDGHGDAEERYAMLVGLADTEAANALVDLPGPPPMRVVEAGAERDSIIVLLQAMTSGAALQGLRRGIVQAADISADRAIEPGPDLHIKPVGVEQSNTSVRVGRDHVLKVIRRLQPGEHPQLEIERFLTNAGFTGAPRLDGSLTYVSVDGRRYAVAALEGWVENLGDGWSFVMAALEQSATDEERITSLRRDMFALGTVTAAFHATLAAGTAPAFAPDPASPHDAVNWRHRVVAHGDRVFAMLDGAHRGWQGRAAHLARRLLEHRSHLAAIVARLDLDRHIDAVRKIRVHGDYHLGQTLKTTSGFILIDFEGEPSRSIDERRAKDCALKDVAGMLRSFDYAEATCASRGVDVSPAVAAMRQGFLDGYFAGARTRAFLPAPDHAAPLLALFELEKALYEIDYELNNRPDWVAIPLAATLRLLGETP